MSTTFARVVRLALAALAILSALPSSSTAGWAQWEPYPWKNVPRTADGKVDLMAPARRTPDGKIDLSGFWVPTERVKHLQNLAADRGILDAIALPPTRTREGRVIDGAKLARVFGITVHHHLFLLDHGQRVVINDHNLDR